MYVYIMYDKKDAVLYVGKTRDMRKRMTQHFGVNKEEWKNEVESIKYMNCYSEVDMSIYEIYFINTLNPRHNASLLYSGESILGLPYELIEYSENINEEYGLNKHEKEKIKRLLVIYEDSGKSKFNSNYINGKEGKLKNVLSNRWCDSNGKKYYRVIKNASSYIRRIRCSQRLKIKNTKIEIWNNFFNLNDSYISVLKNHINRTKKYDDVKIICYLRNDYVCKENTKIVDDKESILRLVNIIKNSAIQNNEKVYAYIPSSRMRKLLEEYLNDKL